MLTHLHVALKRHMSVAVCLANISAHSRQSFRGEQRCRSEKVEDDGDYSCILTFQDCVYDGCQRTQTSRQVKTYPRGLATTIDPSLWVRISSGAGPCLSNPASAARLAGAEYSKAGGGRAGKEVAEAPACQI